MFRPNFDRIPFRETVSRYTAELSPNEKAALGIALGSGVAYPTLAGTVDMFSGPENISNSNEYLTNAGLTAIVPGATAAGMSYGMMKLARPEAHADREIFGMQVKQPESNGVPDAASMNDLKAAQKRAQNQPLQGMGAYRQKYGLYEGARRLKQDHAAALNRRRNIAGAFGAGIGALAGGTAAAQMMMDEHPSSLSSALSMQERQELSALLEANGAY